ncbi:hypothetical protein BXZ70DRAFT_1005153 [Cristinia sonorae]|uniref:BTB domain-containing protein n=1 Tax=Cristinia sonorae TaxID=1940300 RepID=A0A8K0XST4_9AGAR|nr:hypothetical protein BXZ70DRAFT_1005153 [Cristinia sonorae]
MQQESEFKMGGTWDQHLTRDKDYYFEDADCVVRVGGTLFKVHRFLLGRDASAFQDMFAMPPDAASTSGGAPREGSNDAHPIVLYGETEDEFRVLLSALYALPSDLQQYATSHSNVSRLVTISYLTNKYHFTSTSQWAISTLYQVLVQYSTPPVATVGSPATSPTSPTHPAFRWDIERLPEEYDLNSCASELLMRVMDVAMVCGHDELAALVENRWIDRLWNGPATPTPTLPRLDDRDRKVSSYSRADEAKWAVSVADRWELKRLRGVAYYVCLMELGEELGRVAQGASSSSLDTDGAERHDSPSSEESAMSSRGSTLDDSPTAGSRAPPLTPAQTSRLLLGHLSLTRLWDDDLHVHAPGIPAPSPGSCTYHQHGCIYSWVSSWREAARSPHTLKFKTYDVLGRVRSMEKQLVGSDGLIVALTPGCRRKALGAVRERVKNVEDGLGEHFRGVIGGELN